MKELQFDWLQAAYIFVLIFILGFIAGSFHGFNSARKEAVAKGKAEYYLDNNHQRQWRWKE